MSTKARYINPHQASRVAIAFNRAGLGPVTADQCVGYAMNVARHVAMQDEDRALALIDTALDGYTLDREGIAYEAV